MNQELNEMTEEFNELFDKYNRDFEEGKLTPEQKRQLWLYYQAYNIALNEVWPILSDEG